MDILIIGAGPGLSRSVAHLFGRRGFTVSLVARNEDKLIQEVKELESANIKANYIVADVSNEKSLAFVLAVLKSSINQPDVILYNAFSMSNSMEDETWDSLREQLDVNVGGAFTVLKAVLPIMQERNQGKLFVTGGGFGIDPNPDFLGVGIGKAALRNLIYAAAKRVEGTNIHLAILTILGFIGGPDANYSPDRVAEQYLRLFDQQQEAYEVEVIY